MPLSFELHVHERHLDRVVLRVSLEPIGSSIIEGVSLEITDRFGERISHRVLLPVQGTLLGPLHTLAEVRTTDPIPEGASVVGVAWNGDEQVQASVPTDPCTDLRTHLLGGRSLNPARTDALLSLRTDEIKALSEHLPWLLSPQQPNSPEPSYVETNEVCESVDELAKDLDLDDEATEWLKDLLSEP